MRRQYPSTAVRIRERIRNLALPQVAFLLLAWIFLLGLHWQNDGLWFQGDAPRHAANGLFWKELLLSGSLDFKDYALRYYARYPVISPVNYPPMFYILEGTAFALSHASPYIAKGLVLVLSLMTACYLIAWLRRWVAKEAGWAAALLLLLPGYILWSNCIMLNVPATAFAFAALYHARRWMEASIESGSKCQLYLTAVFSLSAILTHFLAGIIVPIILAWVLILRRWDLLWNRRTVCLALALAAIFLPFIYVAFKWAPTYVGFVTRGFERAAMVSTWTFYLKKTVDLTGPILPAVSAVGLAIGTIRRRWRREPLLLFVLMLVAYLSLSLIIAKEGRYGLLICIPIVCFCAIAIQSFAEWLQRLHACKKLYSATFAIVLALCVAQAWIAAETRVPQIQGIREAVAFLEQVAPEEPVFYDGYYHNLFTFYVQAGDPDYKRRVVLGAKLLYASAINSMANYRAYVSSPEEVAKALQTRGGCRWLAIEISKQSSRIPAAALLRKAVQGPEFEIVRSFPVSGPGLDRIEIYRFILDPQPVEEADLPFPILGMDARFKVSPIQR